MPEDNQNFGPLSLTDDELRKRCKELARNIEFSYNSYYAELQRRTQDRHASVIRWLTFVTVLLAAITMITEIAPSVMKFMSELQGTSPVER